MPFSGQPPLTRPRYRLERVSATSFRLLEQFRYEHPATGVEFTIPNLLEVPADDPVAQRWGPFTSDLASVPAPFMWLVPPNGVHTPAALVHDALVLAPGEPVRHLPADVVVTREEADTIFRDAMRELGVPVVRRWLMWTAVALATLMASPGRARLAWRAGIFGLGLLWVALGALQVLDIVDFHVELPWMGDVPWYTDLWRSALVPVGSIVLVSVLALRRWRLFAIFGLAVSTLGLVIVAVGITYGVYLAVEFLVSKPTEDRSADILSNVEHTTDEVVDP